MTSIVPPGALFVPCEDSQNSVLICEILKMRIGCGIIAAAVCCGVISASADDAECFVEGDSAATRIAIYGDNVADAGEYFVWEVSAKAIVGYDVEAEYEPAYEIGDAFAESESDAVRILVFGDEIADSGEYFDWMVSDKTVIGFGEIAADTVPELSVDDIDEWVGEYLAENYAEKYNLSQYRYAKAFTEKFGADLAAAFKAETGKTAADGTKLCVYHDYIAGTDPLDLNSRFTAKIEMKGAAPQVTPDPDLGSARKYTVKGKENLDDAEWADAAENHRFFKVTVEMP